MPRAPEASTLGLDRLFDEVQGLRSGPLQLPERIDPISWIHKHGRLPASASTRSGPVRLYEWQKEIFLAMCGHLRGIGEVVVPKCTQVGLTTLGILASTFLISHEGARVTHAQPNAQMAQLFAEDEVDAIFQEMEVMRDITRPRVQGETQDKWHFRQYLNGGRLRFVGAAANNAFRGYKSRVMICDEIDDENWRDTSDNDEGDKLRLVDQRMETFWNSIKVMFSTPKKRASSLVWREWELSDKCRWHITCPHCQHEQWLKFGSRTTRYGLKWSLDDRGRVTDAWYVCQSEACHKAIPETAKPKLLAAGRWKSTADPMKPGLAGFHVNRLISTSAKARWTRIAQEYVEAEGDPTKLMPFYNLVLGEVWDDWEVGGGERDGLAARAENYEAEVPAGVKRLVCTVDTNRGTEDGRKHNGLEVAVVGVGEGSEMWVLGYEVLDTHPSWSTRSVAELDAIRRREWKRADGTTLRIDKDGVTVCDRGEQPTEVLDYCRSRWRENVWAIKGANVDKGSRLKSIAPGKPSRNVRTGHTWFMVCTQSAKDLLSRMLRQETPGPGYVHFHSALPASFFEGLKAERLVQLKDGSLFWRHTDKKKPNEPWDLLTYAVVAIELAKNASERFVADLNVTSRGPGAAPRIRHDGPNQAWIPARQALAPLIDALRPVAESITASVGAPAPAAAAPSVAPAASPAAARNPWGEQAAEPFFKIRSSHMDRYRR